MTLQEAETYLANCIELGYFEPGAFDEFDEVEKIVFAQHTYERAKLGMFKEENL
jgi:hypothetical protein